MVLRKHKLYSVCALVVVSCVPVAGLIYWRESIGMPSISVEKTQVVLPKCHVGQQFPFSVCIRNDGGRPLHIRIAAATCACSKVRLQKNVLLRGESTRLVGAIRAKRAGPFSSAVVIASNDPDESTTKIVFRGEVEPYVRVWPAVVTLRPDMQRPAIAPLRIQNTDQRPVTISLTVDGISADASVSKLTVGPKETSVIDLSCPAEIIQYDEGQLHLSTDHPLQPSITVPVAVVPVRGLEVHPARLRFGILSRSELRSKRLSLLIEGDLADSASIVKVCVPGFLRVAYSKENPPSGMKEIGLAFREDCGAGAFDDTIAVRLDLRNEPVREATISVPVGGIVR